MDRRSLIKAGMALPIAVLTTRESRAGHDERPTYDEDCGVASGDPRASSVVLWTRLPPAARTGASVPVRCEVSLSPKFEALAFASVVATDASRDYTVKVIAARLEPKTTYYYRFTTESGWISVTGRTRTMPSEDDAGMTLRMAVACCQMFTVGYYTAFEHLAQEDVDLCVHLGDAIYESDRGRVRGRDPLGGQAAESLADYRAKYRFYLSDPLYREVRRLHPWIHVWDDHEVVNDYAGPSLARSNTERMASAYQAYLEYMPIAASLTREPVTGRPIAPIHRSFAFGTTAELIALDERQYRDPMPCRRSYMTPGCAEINEPNRTMLGVDQKRWLLERLKASPARWKILLSELTFAPLKITPVSLAGASPGRVFGRALPAGKGLAVNIDAWDGYPRERSEILSLLQSAAVRNVVVCSGDVHAALHAKILGDERILAHEIGTTSISSSNLAERLSGPILKQITTSLYLSNEHLTWFDPIHHGYTVLDVTPDRVNVRHMAVETVLKPAAKAFVAKNLTIPAERKG